MTWSHYRILLSLKDNNAIKYYINLVKNNNLSVRELKVTELKKEYTGQIEVYMNYIDENDNEYRFARKLMIVYRI